MNIVKTLFLGFLQLSGLYSFAEKPNVVFILSDDQGYGDLACHGNPWIKTPNLDILHSQSVRFTNFHSGTTSSPTRSGIMTGKYCNKVGVWHTVNGREILSSEETTIAEVFKRAGYRTGIFGKWHLGDNYPFRPQDRGFDEALVFKGGGVGNQQDYWNNDYFDDTYFRNGKPVRFKGYCTDVWFSEAIEFIKRNKNRPFFCYLTTNAPHNPYNVEPEYSRLYEGNPAIPNPNFYGMITNIDENVGKLREELIDLKIADNTILVFMTDNGTSGGVRFNKNGELINGYNSGMRGIKGSEYDGGHRVPFFIHWPEGGIKEGRDIPNLSAYIDVMPTLSDLCGIKRPVPEVDGISLKPLIYPDGKNWTDRILFTDTQREEDLVKGKQYAAMTDRWRLVEGDELFDMSSDPGQKINVASQFPDVVEKLRAAYEIWWNDVSRDKDNYQYIKVGSAKENPTTLNSHDLHTKTGLPPFSQIMVRNAEGENGFWAVEITRSGLYEIELCRWPKESKLTLDDSAPEGEMVPGGKPYPEGKALQIKTATIKIGEQSFTSNVEPGSASVKFILNLDAGNTFIQTWLKCEDGTEIGAYYTYIRYI